MSVLDFVLTPLELVVATTPDGEPYYDDAALREVVEAVIKLGRTLEQAELAKAKSGGEL